VRRMRDGQPTASINNPVEFGSQHLQQPVRAQTKQASSTARGRQPLPVAFSRGNIGAAISRPAPMPQWPLMEQPLREEGVDATVTNPPARPRGNPPKRPPRPANVPSLLDASKVQDYTPSFPYRPQQNNKTSQSPQKEYWDDEYGSPTRSEPSPTTPSDYSSRPNTVSSVGTIPDFPLPVPGPPPRRSANLGPPPSSRKGATSYYSQSSYVSPIPEESMSSQRSHGSYASSMVIPSSWGSGPPEYYYDGDPESGIETAYRPDERRDPRTINDDEDGQGLVRQASLGRRRKPALTTIRSSEKTDTTASSPTQDAKKGKLGAAGKAAGLAGAATLAGAAMTGRDDVRNTRWPGPDGFGDDSVLLDASSSDKGLSKAAIAITTDQVSSAPQQRSLSPTDLRTSQSISNYNDGDSLSSTGLDNGSKAGIANRISALRRPPKLNIDAVREAEARGSLTSLPDLIRRATKLAAALDRGRPASRFENLSTGSEKNFSRKFSFIARMIFFLSCD
jgi:hypothetical protein